MDKSFRVKYKGGIVHVVADELASDDEIKQLAYNKVTDIKEVNKINKAQYEAGKGTIQRKSEELVGETLTAVGDTALTVAGGIAGLPGTAIRTMYEEKGKEVPSWVDWIDGYNPVTEKSQEWLRTFAESELAREMEALPPTMGGPINKTFKNSIKNKVKRKDRKVPTVEELKQLKNTLYKEAKDIGATFDNTSVGKLTAEMTEELKDLGYNQGDVGLSGVSATLKQFRLFGKGKRGVDLRDMERLRKQAGNIAGNKDATISAMGMSMIHKIDEFSEGIGAQQLKSGSKEAIAKITLARDAYKKFAKSKNWDMMYEIASNKAGANQTSQKILEIMRKDVGRMFNSQNGMKQLRFFSGSEREALKGFVRGERWDKVLQNMGSLGSPRWAGSLSASSGVIGGAALGAAAGLGTVGSAGIGLGLGAGSFALGQGAKALGNSRNMRKFKDIGDSFATGTDIKKDYFDFDPNVASKGTTPMNELIAGGISQTPKGILDVWDNTALTPNEISELDLEIENTSPAIPL
jgi:hypothetical protein